MNPLKNIQNTLGRNFFYLFDNYYPIAYFNEYLLYLF